MGRSKFLYLSHSIDKNTPSYGNRDKFIDDLNTSFKNGAKAETSNWYFSNNHFGTHIDAPRHFVPDGKTITDFRAAFWVFKNIACIEINCSDAVLIDSENISTYEIDRDAELLLIKTGYEQYRNTEKYWNENPGLAPDLGFFLKQTYPKLRAIGFDFISVTSFQHREFGRDAHLALLNGERPVLPIEDMSLTSIDASTAIHEVFVLPLRVEESNGAPVTVLAEVFNRQSES